MKIRKIKNKIKHLAKDFNLKYNSKWFDYMWISKRDEIILQYIGNCHDNVYEKYGNYPGGRIKNIAKFFNKDLKGLSKRYGGEAYSVKSLKYQKRIIQNIRNNKIKNEIEKLLKKIEKRIITNKIALLTKTTRKKELHNMQSVLIHEWIHILLAKNKIDFNLKNYNWKYNEGLVTYLTWILEDKTYRLEDGFKNFKSTFEKHYYSKAIEFRKLLKNKKTPKERKQTIMKFYNSLK